MSTEGKIKFYKLTELDLPLIFEMNESEMKVYCWLNVHLPFEDSKAVEIDTARLAEEIGISRRSVQRALKSLESRNLFDVEITKAKIKRLASPVSSSDTDVVETPPVSSKRHSRRQNATHVAETPPVSPSKPENLTQQAIQNPKTIKTYSEFKDSLSDSERESFEKFVREEYYKDTSKKIRSFNAFMSDDHFQEWLEIWNNRPEAAQATAANKWQSHSQYSEWLAEIEQTGNPAMFALSDKEKQAFVNWCWETKQFSWLKEEGSRDGI